MDRVVVDGHVIPNQVLFTRTMGNDSYETMAFGDMPKATVRLRVQPYPEKAPGSFCEYCPARFLSAVVNYA